MFGALRRAFDNVYVFILKVNKKVDEKVDERVDEIIVEEVSSYQPCFENCVSLETSVEIFSKVYEIKNISIEVEEMCLKIYSIVSDYVKVITEPTFDEIDAMLMVCSILLAENKKELINEFIFMCPKKFIITYSNNSEKTPRVLQKLKKMDLDNVCEYLISHVHKSKLATWNERDCILSLK